MRMGQALRFAPLLSACMRKARGGPIQTIAPGFDGLKVFPALAGLSIARFGRISYSRLASHRCLSPRGFRTYPYARRVTGDHQSPDVGVFMQHTRPLTETGDST